ncbi:MAG: hypothetical protein H6819_07870 [Phycisphaerales bacterium]|nr:hypothetical protein [Phycisphaerales bacterium]MCB9854308.1 hypothetical protein [Phycisphaerales bacterium]MCB9863509.1 hypothetical protein [Phycisphaerales bacterium]
MNRYAKLNAPTVTFAGAVMLFWAWYTGGGGWSYPASASAFFVFTLHAFDWMLLIGGAAMVAVGIVCYAGARVGLLLETIVSALCGLVMLMCAGTWLAGGALGINTILVGFFGVTFTSGARSAWVMYRASDATGGQSSVRASTPVVPAAPPPPHPASQASSALPKDGEPPPEEGYLAALSKEED